MEIILSFYKSIILTPVLYTHAHALWILNRYLYNRTWCLRQTVKRIQISHDLFSHKNRFSDSIFWLIVFKVYSMYSAQCSSHCVNMKLVRDCFTLFILFYLYLSMIHWYVLTRKILLNSEPWSLKSFNFLFSIKEKDISDIYFWE